VQFDRSASFPSGHVTGAVSFYGLLTLLTLKNVTHGRIRVVVPVVSVLIIALASVARVYSSAHWPSDILGSYLFGVLGVAGIAALYDRIKGDRLSIPGALKRKSAVGLPNSPGGRRTAHSIASTVVLDPVAGTATKRYEPPLPVRALYRIAFQAPFPYCSNGDALQAAAAKRQIVDLLCQHWFGYQMVAAVHDIRSVDSRYEFVTEFVSGTAPESNAQIEVMLSELYAHFQTAGLPTWQIAPGNPHAYSNFIRACDGNLKLIDLESALVSLSYPWQELPGYLRAGRFPVFDDVDFRKLRRYVDGHALSLQNSIGSEGLSVLLHSIESAEALSASWKESEPRIWGRAVRALYRVANVRSLFACIRDGLSDTECAAKAIVSESIDHWENDGQIGAEQADALRAALSSSACKTLLKHLGAHIFLTMAIAIPIPGLRSLARCAWTLTFRLASLIDFARGRITREEYRVARSIHSVPVMLLALVPAVGALAYGASDIMLKQGLGRMLIDHAAQKMPLRLYSRFHLARLIVPNRDNASVASALVHEERPHEDAGERVPSQSGTNGFVRPFPLARSGGRSFEVIPLHQVTQERASEEVGANDVAGPMRAQIDPRDANGKDQHYQHSLRESAQLVSLYDDVG
jgi:hypothetical protein